MDTSNEMSRRARSFASCRSTEFAFAAIACIMRASVKRIRVKTHVRAVEEQQVAGVYRFSPAAAVAVVQRNERRAAMREAQRVLHRHICRSGTELLFISFVTSKCTRICTTTFVPQCLDFRGTIRAPAHGAEPSLMSDDSRCGLSAALASWWSRDSHTAPYARHTRNL